MDSEYLIDTLDTKPLFIEPDNYKKVFVGVAISKGKIEITGQHAFIMVVNEKLPDKSIMLDASGHYGSGRSCDIVDGQQITITIPAYLRYWDVKQYLYIFELKVKNSDEDKIENLIRAIEERSWLSCTDKASALLLETGLFNGLKHRKWPKHFLNDLLKYSKLHPEKMVVTKYDMETNLKVSLEGK